jgi:hypothetical protein
MLGNNLDAALLVVLQAWFPAHAEIWNAPTWFLSALTFAMVVLPHVLPAIAAMRKKGLKLLLVSLSSRSPKHQVAAPEPSASHWLGATRCIHAIHA